MRFSCCTGYLLPTDPLPAGLSVEPLLQTGAVSGSNSFFDLVMPTQTGLVLNTSVSREAANRNYVLAVRVHSSEPIQAASAEKPINIVAIADVDFISDSFFDIRAQAQASADFDNIVFFLNTIDQLAGDQSFITLRSRNARRRTLERLEVQTRVFMERRTQEEQAAEREAQEALIKRAAA